MKHYLSLVKFSHTIFAMPFAMIGFFLAISEKGLTNTSAFTGTPFIHSTLFQLWYMKLLLVVICMITARSAAMAYNRYLDRQYDAKNPRTAIREIPKGIISPQNAFRFVVINCLLFITATFFINPMCFYLSPVALFVILFYSYTKRFTALCHLVLGLGLSLAPIGAYLAVTGAFALLPILFSITVITWVSGFDIIYAMQDVAFDQSQNLYSIPVMLGKANALKVATLLHVVSTACVLVAGWYGHFHWLYWVGAMVFTGMLIYQHAIVQPDDLSRVNIAFMTANGVASVVFGTFVIIDLLCY